MSAILGVLFASLIGLLMIPTYMHFEQISIDNAKAATTAQQMQQVSQAAQAYIQANYAAVEANSSATSPATITVSMLQNTGYLPNAFGATNPYGQSWQVQVLQPTPGQLQALVLTQGGTQIGQTQAPMIAAQAGAQGGFVPYNGQYGTLNATVAHGAYSGWQVSLSNYANPGPGHLAALLYFNNGNLENDYLYRVAVPGQPQLNTMQTNLNMGNNSIGNAHDVQAGPVGQCVTDASGHCTGEVEAAGTTQADMPAGWQGGMTTRDLIGVNGTIGEGTGNGAQPQAYLNDYGNGSQGGSGGQVVAVDPANGNYAVMNSAVNTGGVAPEIYTNGIIDAGTGVGSNSFATFNGAWWANNSGDSSQTGNAYVGGQVTANYDAVLGTAGGTANVGWGCSPNGEIAANANGSGQLLVCQNGQWTANGSPRIIGQWWLGTTGFYNFVYLTTAAYCSMNAYGQYANTEAGVQALSGGPGAYNWYYFNNGSTNDIMVTCFDN